MRTVWMNSSAIATALVLGAAPQIAAAQSSVAPKEAAIEEVVVTARRVEERLQSVPIAVTALSGESLEQHNVRDVRDLVGLVPNFTMEKSTTTFTGVFLDMRGQHTFQVLLSDDIPIGMYADGVPIPHPYEASAALVDLARVEVLRGPQGTLFGKSTTGGAISFVTNEPKPGFGGSVSVEAGTGARAVATGVLNVPLGEDFGARFVAYAKQHEGYGHDAADRDLAGGDDTVLRAKLKGTFGRAQVNLGAEYLQLISNGLVTHLTAVVRPASFATPTAAIREATLARGLAPTPANFENSYNYLLSFLGGPPDYYDASTRDPGTRSKLVGRNFDATFQYELTDNLTLKSISGYRWHKNQTVLGGGGEPLILQAADLYTYDKFYSEEIQLLGTYDRFNWVAGAFYSKETGTEFNYNYATPFVANNIFGINDSGIDNRSYAIFGQANWNFAPAWTLTAGGRVTKDRKWWVNQNRRTNGVCLVPVEMRSSPAVCYGEAYKSWKSPTWLVTLKYQPTEDLNIYAKVARGYKSGGHNLRGQTVNSIRPYDPEYVTEYEAGLKSMWFDGTVRLNIAAFYDNYTNAQRSILELVGNQTAPRITNAAKARIWGVEAEGVWVPFRGLTLEGSLGWIDPKYKEFSDANGDRSREPWPTPKVTYALTARYKHSTDFGDLSYIVNWVYKSNHVLAPTVQPAYRYGVTQPGYGLLDARIALDFADGKTQLSVYGRNLLQKHYLTGAVALDVLGILNPSVGDPRIFGVQLTRRFGSE
jgi:iron complex outermembrane recepter protein